jgi:ribonuclease HI
VASANREYLVYADGSCIGNPGPGGWGVVVRDPDGNVIELNGHDDSTTNNRMEITAAIEGLRATERGAQVLLRSDSEYVVKSMTLNWKRNKNNDLWDLLDAEAKSRRVRFEWVRGHGSDPTNNRADELALMGSNGQLVADGASPKRKPTPAAAETELAPLLRAGESIRECRSCGAKFVTSSADDYCSHVRCQLKARTPSS